ncbi:hypothetical protein Bca52824_028704 [Brassica carinata]|uniref:Uncharacterized protein n=1 Tax=Brassica carinata TaxID=52824 RepID=A0A8X7VCP6_BRACI|nr:hypothetical protein Bca52824_028704 [Brassica carinata]
MDHFDMSYELLDEKNSFKACVEANVKRVVYVSSAAALMMNPNWSKNQVIDESCWSDLEFCKRTETQAESEAFEFAKRTGIGLVSICPTMVFGPVLKQHTVNASTLALAKLLLKRVLSNGRTK